ncbi:response regulator [Asticcacaulis biprosthecium C19]|uniref:Response regulator n=1 Tax=Asticcacaulis biprosthecium C19 TaxID=715226 RepID=F4QTQ2_9CAUL|nr:response regulator transcription factor [Asticcacaulis biprosthecium]EGF89202.1 response regulator [Asticcacaulis biprosthecium C19]
MRLLLIEDDAMLGSAVRDGLTPHHAVDWVRTLADAALARSTTAYDLILLDLGLPDGSGLAWLTQLRRSGDSTPVLILTARDAVGHRIEGLDSGADDYLVKPFDLDELIARCRALLRRASEHVALREVAPGVDYDPQARRILYHHQPVHLSAREMAVFERLVAARGGIVSKGQIEESLYDWSRDIDSNTVEVHISSIRHKLSRDVIQTVRGMGYRLATQT